MKRKVALGEAHATTDKGIGQVEAPATLEQRIAAIENQLHELVAAFNEICRTAIKDKRQQERYDQMAAATADVHSNNDGIPIGTTLVGTTTKFGGLERFLIVREDGYYLGDKKCTSLSHAAEEVSKVRRSGREFWKLLDGKTVNEAFPKVKG
jgi:hypothetical protein